MKVSSVNLAVIGHPAVGKSALTVRYLTRRFIGEYSSLKDETYSYYTTVNGETVKQHILDCCKTPVGVHFQKLVEWSNGLLVVFSLTDLASFYAATAVLKSLNQQPKAPPFILVANKSDLYHVRCLSYKWGMEAATAKGCPYIEVSSATGLSEVELVFSSLTNLAIRSKRSEVPVYPILRDLVYRWKRKMKYNYDLILRSRQEPYI